MDPKIGLKCGLEIHQQLEGKKLFCDCPTQLRDDQPDFEIRRKLRAVAGEHGEIDVAALQEQLKGKEFVYQGYHKTTCLVETDSEPPHALNQDALYTTLQLSKLVEASVSPIVQVMRKTVVDGSNTSGFQRTALIARKGLLKTSQGEVRIDNISLEEDACKIISENHNQKVYRLDKLGIPMIEIGTAPDIKTPQQCKETSEKLGMLLRSLPGVKRGLGTIRQDVNVSIKGGVRIEFKGVQDLRMIPTIIELEVKRQQELLKLKEELRHVRLDKLEVVELNTLLQ
ncbi:MAG: Glu-tRNA(Gln) amidotransferase subunit GatE, partial [Nanoarchaeota archaeon]|nr:Glu-tRNA(Gln) amidotransferase subunit GatE [Nanoarchaeota archaeon]